MDEFGNSDEDDLELTVEDTIPPVAVISGSLKVLEGESLHLSGLDSTDNGRIVEYTWDFEDMGDKVVKGPHLNHSFEQRGHLNVSLTVEDEWGNQDSIDVQVDVVDTTAPKARSGIDRSVPAGTTVVMDGTNSSDNGLIVDWRWTFTYDNDEVTLNGMIVQFRFDIPGDYIITLSICDQSENCDDDSFVLSVIGQTDDDQDDDPLIDDDAVDEKGMGLVTILIVIGLTILILLSLGILLVYLILRRKDRKEIETEDELDKIERDLITGTASPPVFDVDDGNRL
jgi:hypothetical protein